MRKLLLILLPFILFAKSPVGDIDSYPMPAGSDVRFNPYITDGLVVMWDGEWNIGLGMHDSESTVWRDIVSGFEMPVCKCASWLDDRIDINVTDNWVETGNTSGPISMENRLKYYCMRCIPDASWRTANNTGQFTQEYVFRLIDQSVNPAVSNGDLVSSIGGLATFPGCQLYARYGGSSYLNRDMQCNRPDLSNRITLFNVSTVPVSCYASFSAITNGYGVIYKNGKQLHRSLWAQQTGLRGFFTVGTGAASLRYGGITLNGDGYNNRDNFKHVQFMGIRIYNRQLSAEEIAHNYAIDKKRFNLP